jgi:hypothetical protein
MHRDLFETLRHRTGSLNLHHPEMQVGRRHRRGDRASTSNTEKARGNPGRALELAALEIVCRAFRIIN